MPNRSNGRRRQNGQILILFALMGTVLIASVGLVLDGGYALSQRRASQNASDFAALAGARVLSEFVAGDTNNGTDANVKLAIENTININRGAPITYGSPSGPVYVNTNGTIVPSVGAAGSFVGNGIIPTGAVGVQVTSTRTWHPAFLSILGFGNWSAAATATAKGGYAAGGPGGNVFPAGVGTCFFGPDPSICPNAPQKTPCAGPINTTNPADPCYSQNLTPGNLNVPGGFGWLKFGATGKCSGYGLGMDTNNGCQESAPFLQSEIGPPPNSYGCCTKVGLGGADKIGSLPGNKASADCSYYVTNQTVVVVPVWDVAGGTGANAWYHIVGFAGFQITGCPGAKNLSGVWRQAVFLGPTVSTLPFKGASLAVQLIQ